MTGTEEGFELAGAFPAADLATWRAAVDQALSRDSAALSVEERDALFVRRLVTRTQDGIALRPLYTRRDWPHDAAQGLPGSPPFVRGSTAAGAAQGGWDVRSRVALGASEEAAAAQALAELEGGATSLLVEAGDSEPNVTRLDQALRGVDLELAPVVLDAGPRAATWAHSLLALWAHRGVPDAAARGGFGIDPLGELARSGSLHGCELALYFATRLGRLASDRYPGVRVLTADASLYHEAGASAAEELGCALAVGVAYLRELTAAGLSVDAALGQIEFRFAATADQFTTIAKLRAARLAWDRVAAVAGASAARRGPALHAQTSRAMLTRHDPWVNLLRASLACFAAGVGGATAITVAPFDARLRELPSELGRRLARNTQAILIEEAHVGRVLDPAGGSAYVECLTAELAARAWSWFQEIEAAGGARAALEAGLIQARVAQTRSARAREIATRRAPLTGVSEFPNLADETPPPLRDEQAHGAGPGDRALPRSPHARAFEELRDRADAIARETGTRPSVFLATLGPLAEHTPRAAFCKNLFEAGGIAAVSAGSVDRENAAARFGESGAALVCVCGSDERYAEQAEGVVRALRAAGPRRLYLAGAAQELRAALEQAGVEEFIVAGCDAIDVLTRAQRAAEVQHAA